MLLSAMSFGHLHIVACVLLFVSVTSGCRGEAEPAAAPPAAEACPAGQEPPEGAPEACCFPGQLWVDEQGCVGVPTRCHEGFELRERRCSLALCPAGQERAADGVHCCWPAQGYDPARGGCVGLPDCPGGWRAEDDACVADEAPTCDPPSVCRDACQAGQQRACVALADHHVATRTPELRAAAIELLEGACHAGAQEGCAALSLLLVRDAPERALELASAACDAGVPRGCGNLGVIHSRGLGTDADPDRAATLFRRACDAGWGEACADLGYLHRRGLGGARSDARARALYAQGCELGSAQGCANLGALLDEGVGGEVDRGRAAELYQRACSGGSMSGCTHLGTLYKLGEGVERDHGRARTLYLRACEGRHARACLLLGYLHLLGRGVPRDAAEAARHFVTACELRDGDACFALGKLLMRGEGVPEASAREGIALIDSACALEHAEACYTAALFYAEATPGSPREALSRHRRACELGYEKSCRALPEATPEDLDALTHRCVREGSGEACVRAGARHLFAQDVPKDEAKAAIFFERGCDAGALEGCLSLGVLYEHGSGVAADPARARQLYQEACGASQPLACHNLARLLRPHEPERALDLFDRACELGHEPACTPDAASKTTTSPKGKPPAVRPPGGTTRSTGVDGGVSGKSP